MKLMLKSSGLVRTALLLVTIIYWQPTVMPMALAQSSKGAVAGTITDPAGAVIGGAAVKITNASTNVVRETLTTADGAFRIDAVDPGDYKIEVIATGFKSIERNGIIVAAAQATDASVTLEVGTSSEVIDVTFDNNVVLQKQDGARTSTLAPRQLVDLPVAGLNPVNLVFTLPGVTNPGVLAGGFVQGTEFNINGLRARGNNQLIDGTDNNDNSITGQFFPSVLRDGFREVSVLGGNNSAEYGHAGGAIVSIAANLHNPLIHTWSFGVQRQTPGKVIVDAAYVGTRGMGLFINEQINSGVNGVRLFSTHGPVTLRTNGGDSIYHSLQTRIERDLRRGFLARFAYTYSKAIDDVNSEIFVTTGGSSIASDPFNRRVDRSVASFDTPHRAVWTLLWDVPGPARGLSGEVAGGWTLSGIYRIQSGSVESPFVGGLDLNGDLNSFNDRPSVSNPNAPPTSVGFANTLLGISGNGFSDINGAPINPGNVRFVVDPANRANIAGRNTLRGDVINSMDIALNKAFPLPFEQHRLEVRIEFFNVLNHPNFNVCQSCYFKRPEQWRRDKPFL